MTTPPPDTPSPHALLISLLQSNPAMERGKLTAEYRERPSAEGGPPVKRGPYLKLQGREHGQHFTRRVSAKEAEVLKEHIGNFERFTELTEAVLDASVAQGRAERAKFGGRGLKASLSLKKTPCGSDTGAPERRSRPAP